ncbi:MAG: DNA-directed RNA polymerase subunit K [Nanoarchaeota archaeon]
MAEKEHSKYEKTRLISARALQIAQGSPILINPPKTVVKSIDIAELEWKAGVIPIDIRLKKRE